MDALKNFMFTRAKGHRRIQKAIAMFYYRFLAAKFVNAAYVALFEKTSDGKPAIILGEGWDGVLSIPGGTLEEQDEGPKQGAIREVLEETGITLFVEQLTDMPISDSQRRSLGVPRFSMLYAVPRFGVYHPKASTKNKEIVAFHRLTLEDIMQEKYARRIPGNINGGMFKLARDALFYAQKNFCDKSA